MSVLIHEGMQGEKHNGGKRYEDIGNDDHLQKLAEELIGMGYDKIEVFLRHFSHELLSSASEKYEDDENDLATRLDGAAHDTKQLAELFNDIFNLRER